VEDYIAKIYGELMKTSLGDEKQEELLSKNGIGPYGGR
jgi:hypothetical protein